MTNSERILAALRATDGLSDSELRQRTGVEPHQQVNQICRTLEKQGRLHRLERADGRIGNYLVEDATALKPVGAPLPSSPSPVDTGLRRHVLKFPAVSTTVPPVKDTLIVLPCSGKKAHGGTSEHGASILDLLSPALADRLVSARRRVGALARLDETQLLPAWRRYSGTLYAVAGERLASAVTAGLPMLVISGGYGLVLAEESVGIYNRRFSLHDWPTHLLEECLATAAVALGVRTVVAFSAWTTDYANVIRRAPWSKCGIAAWLASPDMGGGGGAQVFVPRVSGEAFAAFLSGELHDQWGSTDGIPVRLAAIA